VLDDHEGKAKSGNESQDILFPEVFIKRLWFVASWIFMSL
jgi:hypothetical protein